jgi:hypothetical protein
MELSYCGLLGGVLQWCALAVLVRDQLVYSRALYRAATPTSANVRSASVVRRYCAGCYQPWGAGLRMCSAIRLPKRAFTTLPVNLLFNQNHYEK